MYFFVLIIVFEYDLLHIYAFDRNLDVKIYKKQSFMRLHNFLRCINHYSEITDFIKHSSAKIFTAAAWNFFTPLLNDQKLYFYII